MAKEVIVSSNYDQKVDSWSAGVTLMEIAYGLPLKPTIDHQALGDWITQWTTIIAQRAASSKAEDTFANVLKAQLRIDADKSLSARQCLDMGVRNGIFVLRDGITQYVDMAKVKEATRRECEGASDPE
ncbi:hypothetical protein BU23DRAFT_566997 [Bimuria novae-zelandiae CBS 107.79]|uniref:Protein kinase domain-containing protein n=1 Tax=Bimuria novae-zelandiae CBS 107.79 TaxID=1447943 RepID=A0A6A5VC12_9PLEO|nr:hypothetical protein BU23DRAFT_566997 [Bimuria novae-zelandiae CBS 107.79]